MQTVIHTFPHERRYACTSVCTHTHTTIHLHTILQNKQQNQKVLCGWFSSDFGIPSALPQPPLETHWHSILKPSLTEIGNVETVTPTIAENCCRKKKKKPASANTHGLTNMGSGPWVPCAELSSQAAKLAAGNTVLDGQGPTWELLCSNLLSSLMLASSFL